MTIGLWKFGSTNVIVKGVTNMAYSMEHWNGDQIASVDIETTGLDPNWHEILQIAIVPLTSNFERRKDVLPFYIEMCPDHPERADKEAMDVSRLKLAEIAIRGHDKEKAKDLLMDWVKKLKLPCTKYGTPKRIIMLGQNITFDKPFIVKWLGMDMFNEYFDSRMRDTMVVANYLNDRAGMHAEKVPYPKVNLAWLAKTHNIEHSRAHDALQDCMVAAQVYKKMCEQGLIC